jgi:hypothetical protein
MPALDREDNVFVLDLGDGENRFHPDWISPVNRALDDIEAADGPRALVTARPGGSAEPGQQARHGQRELIEAPGPGTWRPCPFRTR